MSTYYEYEEVKQKIVHRLFKLNGWKVYGWRPDESELMTDYYSPESWGGVATKNEYTLCVNVYGEQKEDIYREIKKTYSVPAEVINKINKLREMTMARGASAQEEETAKKKINVLYSKYEKVTGDFFETKEPELVMVKHMAHPTRCNWHLEKDGIIIDKGTGLLKFSNVLDITGDRDLKTWQKFNSLSPEDWKAWYINELVASGHCRNFNAEELKEQAAAQYKRTIEEVKLLEEFNQWINKIDSLAGGLVGKGGYTYEKYSKTEYRTEYKAKETPGSIKVGQCFVLKRAFNNGHHEGLVFKITNDYDKSFSAYKFNKKLTKLCTGMGDRSNYFSASKEKFNQWIEKGYIAFCEIEEVKTPYEVEKVRKVKNDSQTEAQEEQGTQTEQTREPAKDYTIKEGTRPGAVEVYFNSKPEQKILIALKNLGMRWNNSKKCWFGFIETSEIEKAIAA